MRRPGYVFGQTISQHNARHMRLILRIFGRLTALDNPRDRTELLVHLLNLEGELTSSEGAIVTEWMSSGGRLSALIPRRSTVNAAAEPSIQPLGAERDHGDNDSDGSVYGEDIEDNSFEELFASGDGPSGPFHINLFDRSPPSAELDHPHAGHEAESNPWMDIRGSAVDRPFSIVTAAPDSRGDENHRRDHGRDDDGHSAHNGAPGAPYHEPSRHRNQAQDLHQVYGRVSDDSRYTVAELNAYQDTGNAGSAYRETADAFLNAHEASLRGFMMREPPRNRRVRVEEAHENVAHVLSNENITLETPSDPAANGGVLGDIGLGAAPLGEPVHRQLESVEETLEYNEHDENESEPTDSDVSTDGESVLERMTHFHDSQAHDNTGNGRECQICFYQRTDIHYVAKSSGATCEHLSEICKICIDNDIKFSVQAGLVDKIACPICPAIISEHDIQVFASKDIYKRLIYIRKRKAIPAGFITCLAANCEGAQLHEGLGPMMCCTTCSYKMCTVHTSPWHEGLTCLEFDTQDSQIDRLEEEDLTARELAKDTMICQGRPGETCNQAVYRIEGCNHIECICGFEFCFLCGADWENVLRIGATAHARFCEEHPDTISLTKAQKQAKVDDLAARLHGGQVNATLLAARAARNERVRQGRTPKAAAAVERRTAEAAKQSLADASGGDFSNGVLKRKFSLHSAWEEGGSRKR